MVRAVGGRWVGALYAANTGGAMIGALATALWLAPSYGFRTTLLIFAAANLAAALAIFLVPCGRGTQAAAAPPAPQRRAGARLAIIALTGFLGIGFEVAGVRALAQMLENTVYSFAAALAVYLLATAVGAAIYQRFSRGAEGLSPVAWLAGLTGLGAALGTLALFAVPEVYAAVRGTVGPGTLPAVAAELAVSALVFGPAALAMGALFTHLAQGLAGPDGGLGRAVAANTGAAALAPLTVGVIAVPAIGVVDTMLVLTLGYAVLAAAVALAGSRSAGMWLAAGTAGLAALATLGPFDHRLVQPPPGGRVLTHLEGVSASASIVETEGGARYLRVNGTFTMGGTASYTLDRLQAHLALLQHPGPRRALFLGVGTGATLAAVADHPGLVAEAVDLSPEVLALVPEFETVQADLARAGQRIRIRVGDARRAVRVAAPGAYDLILADTYHPAKDGAGLLYTAEHFRAIRTRLAPGGVFVQWLPLHQLDLPTLRLIVRTFQSVYPNARMAMGNYNLPTPLLALYGSRDGRPPDITALIRREMPRGLRAALGEVGLDGPLALFGGMMAGPEALARFAGPGPLNTDDYPLVVYKAPDTVYSPLAPAGQRLMSLVEALEIDPSDAVDLSGLPDRQAAGFAARLAAYWQARDRFLAQGLAAVLTGDPVVDARQLAPGLLQVLQISPDFGPASRAMEGLIRAVGRADPALARALATRLRIVIAGQRPVR